MPRSFGRSSKRSTVYWGPWLETPYASTLQRPFPVPCSFPCSIPIYVYMCLYLHLYIPKAQNSPKALYSMVFGPKNYILSVLRALGYVLYLYTCLPGISEVSSADAIASLLARGLNLPGHSFSTLLGVLIMIRITVLLGSILGSPCFGKQPGGV